MKTFIKILTSHKKALFDYTIEESFECGIELKGYEVKTLRGGKGNLKGSFIIFTPGGMFLKDFHIPPLSTLGSKLLDTRRARKIFLHTKDIIRLSEKVKETGKTCIPLEVYLKGSLIKIKVALASGKKKYDKKQVLKERSMDKEAKIQMKKYTH